MHLPTPLLDIMEYLVYYDQNGTITLFIFIVCYIVFCDSLG